MKLELKHLAPYLPYELGIYTGEFENTKMIGILGNEIYTSPYKYKTPNHGDTLFTRPRLNTIIDFVKPILRPVEFKNFILNETSYEMFHQLVKEHYDVFGLIDTGLAINIHTLKNHD